MCHASCIEFGRASLREEDVRGKAVIEVGSLDVNGSLRPFVEALRPAGYTGVDLRMGPGVDEVCDACGLLKRFGCEAFDLLISTELLEHVRDWRTAISNFKRVLKPNGVVLITTRSLGFPYHAYPSDFWRYEVSDVEAIFSDFIVEALQEDGVRPGVLLKARKPAAFSEFDTADYRLYSVIKRRRVSNVTEAGIRAFMVRRTVRRILLYPVPLPVKRQLVKLREEVRWMGGRGIAS